MERVEVDERCKVSVSFMCSSEVREMLWLWCEFCWEKLCLNVHVAGIKSGHTVWLHTVTRVSVVMINSDSDEK